MTPNAKHKTGIKKKVMTILIISNLIIIAIGIGLGYFLGSRLLYDVIGRDYQKLAEFMASYTATQIKGEAEDVMTYASRPLWIDMLTDINKKYNGMSNQSIQQYLADMDKRWVDAGQDDPIVKEYLDSRVADSMRDIITIRGNVAEIFITDKYGGLVASSGKTSDFYQADEPWWQEAYSKGKGSLYIGDIEFDQSSNSWSMPMAAPIMGSDGNIIGVCKQMISTERLFGRLEEFKSGRTGHAAVIDKDGRILYHGDLPRTADALFYDKDIFKKISTAKKKYFMEDAAGMHGQKMFSAFAVVPSSLLSERGMDWAVIVSQTADEVFRPATRLIAVLASITIVMMLVLLPVGYAFANKFVRPVHELHMATDEIIKGNWDYPINIRTGDEIEQFADTFREMLRNVKNDRERLLQAKKELEELSRDLEKKVEERTKELTRAQEATLNILEDLTESKGKIETYAGELEEALKVKTEFTSTVSHELRTPLAAIKEGIAIVLDGTSGPLGEDQTRFLDIAKRNVDRLARLINDILDFQKLEAGRMTFRMEEYSINEVVKEAVTAMAPLADAKGLEFILDLDDGLPRIRFDRDKIIQVLTNLINNAIKFTEKGHITVYTKPDNGFIRISVQDTGAGIKQEDIPRLFLQFEQIDKGIDRKTGGTGLGLAISKEIVARHNGKIWAESDFGKGSTFHFVLPVPERKA